MGFIIKGGGRLLFKHSLIQETLYLLHSQLLEALVSRIIELR